MVRPGLDVVVRPGLEAVVVAGTVDVVSEGPVVADEGTDDPPLVGVDGVEDEGMEGVRSDDRSLSEHAPMKAAATPRPTIHLVGDIARPTIAAAGSSTSSVVQKPSGETLGRN